MSTRGSGEIVDEKFEVISGLGQGGFGQVYLARQLAFDRMVALKFLSASYDDVDAHVRFEREARILSALEHPHIGRVLKAGLWRGEMYTALEFFEGETLQELLSREGTLTQARAFEIGSQILKALSAAHGAGVVHRDLKPSNIMMSPTGVKLIDFGLAFVVLPEGSQRLTQDGMAIGNALCMAPEQCLGRTVDHRADLYAVGCLLYRMLTGEHPFVAGTGVAVMFKHMNEALPATGSEALDALLNRFCAKDPEQRVGSAEEALELLNNFGPKDVPVKPIAARKPSVPTKYKIALGVFCVCLVVLPWFFDLQRLDSLINAAMLSDNALEAVSLAKERDRLLPGSGMSSLRAAVENPRYKPIIRATLMHHMNTMPDDVVPLSEKIELLRRSRDLTAGDPHPTAHIVATALYGEALKKAGPQRYAEAKSVFQQALRELDERARKEEDPDAHSDIRRSVLLWWQEAASAAHDQAAVKEIEAQSD